MKGAAFEAVNLQDKSSFLLRTFEVEVFPSPYHFHPELELTFIAEGEGSRFVGADISAFKKGDLVFIGPELAHCWKSGSSSTENNTSKSIVIQFPIDFLGAECLNKVEFQHIQRLLEKSNFGIHFFDSTADEAGKKMKQLGLMTAPFERFICFLEILNYLASSSECTLLNNHYERSSYNPAEYQRLHDVKAYIVDNFREQILLDEAAGIAKMSVSAFCKYYKKVTGQTFVESVLDYRINYAAQQLTNTDKPINTICFESGFGDPAHFFRSFKKRKKFSPSKYRAEFLLSAASVNKLDDLYTT